MMTTKQEQYIVSLANKLTGKSWPNQIKDHKTFLHLSPGQCKRLSKSQASAIIDDLTARIEETA